MKVTYTGHSGFLLETDAAYYLIDYIRGQLPDFCPDKPLYVMASHWHGDHFAKEIFASPLGDRVTRFVLSRDIYRKHKKQLPEWAGELNDRITWVLAGNSYELDGCTVSTLKSTDVGVAFVLREKNGCSFYHAGDLNWWHWEGEPDPWNPNVEKAYKKEIDKLANISFDVAFVPLDPRLQDAYWYGLGYFEEKVKARHIFPMHFWEDYDVIPRYIFEHPSADGQQSMIHIIHQEGEEYEF